MSTFESTISERPRQLAARSGVVGSAYSRLLAGLCSVRFGVTLLCLLTAACLAGMLVMQQNVDGFDRYFADLSPWRRTVYSQLGLFDIYRSWYFNGLLGLLSLNIILASVERFPKAWVYVARPRVAVPVRWLRGLPHRVEFVVKGSQGDAASSVADAFKLDGWRSVTVEERSGRTFVFGQRGAWNRLGAYFVHIGLLTIFAGGLLTTQFSSGGQMPLSPGSKTNLIKERVASPDGVRERTSQLPFEITCDDLEQRLIKRSGPLSPQNTIDQVTRFTIRDETGTRDAVVAMKRPFDYRGYRFFQSSSTPVGRARVVTLNVVPTDGGTPESVNIPRDGSMSLTDGTVIRLSEFRGNFRLAGEDLTENTMDYKNPAAVLEVVSASGSVETALAFPPGTARPPVTDETASGYRFELVDFERVADSHVLTVQRDPGAAVVYVGFLLLFLSLTGVFLFSHQRVWAVVEQSGDSSTVLLSGHSNRNPSAFSKRFSELKKRVRGVVDNEH